MLKNYLKVAMRAMLRSKLFSVINIVGLGIGIACCLVIGLFLRHELTYDRFHPDADRLYRVLPDLPTITVASLPVPLIPALQQSYSEITHATRLFARNSTIRIAGETFEERITYADPDFFSLFNFPLLDGEPQNALIEPSFAVLSYETARKLFGFESPISKAITVIHDNQIRSYIVRGIAAPMPHNSSLRFSILLPFENLRHERHASAFDNWYQFWVTGIIRIQENSDINTLHKKLTPFLNQYLQAELPRSDANEMSKGLEFQAFNDYHLGSKDHSPGLEPVGQREHLYILVAIALLILFMACFTSLGMSGQSGWINVIARPQ